MAGDEPDPQLAIAACAGFYPNQGANFLGEAFCRPPVAIE
jgi:hypothetical protein